MSKIWMNKAISILITMLMVLSISACSSFNKGVKDAIPEEIIIETEPAPVETPEGEPTPEDEPVSIEEEGVEISEEYADEAVAFATDTMNSLFTKNAEYTNENRREAVNEVSHPLFGERIEDIQSQLDESTEFEITNLSFDTPLIAEGFRVSSMPTLEKQLAFQINYIIDVIYDGEPSNSEGLMIVLVQDGVFKFASLYGIE